MNKNFKKKKCGSRFLIPDPKRLVIGMHRDDEADEPPEPGEDVRHLRREVALLPRTGIPSDCHRNQELKKKK